MSKTHNIKLSEHRKHRNQCRRRFKWGLKLIAVLAVVFVLGLIFAPDFWPLFLAILLVFCGTTALEYRGYKKHESSLKQLGFDN